MHLGATCHTPSSMPCTTAPKKIININRRPVIKKKPVCTASAVKSERDDGSTGNGLSRSESMPMGTLRLKSITT